MMRLIGFSVLVVGACMSSGCAMCCAPYDYHYLAQAGRWVRYNPTTGRVGSAFENVGGPADASPVSAEYETATEGTPTPTPSQTMPMQPQTTPMQPGMTPGYQSSPLPAPSRVSPNAPQTRSVIPRNMGETYLPRGN